MEVWVNASGLNAVLYCRLMLSIQQGLLEWSPNVEGSTSSQRCLAVTPSRLVWSRIVIYKQGQMRNADFSLCSAAFGASGGLAGAGSMTVGLGEQKQGGGAIARRKLKAKRPHK